MAILILWVISPVILGIWLIILGSQRSKLNRQVQQLTGYIRRFYEEGKISEEEYKTVVRGGYLGQPINGAGQQVPMKVYPVVGAVLEERNSSIQSNIAGQISLNSPIYQPRQPIKKVKQPVSTINIVLIVGVLFIILAGLIFATTTWKTLPSVARTAIIFSLVIVFFGTSWMAENKLKLKQTSIAFYTLGTIFLPITLIAVGYFRLLGNWFTLMGEGRYLLGLIAFVLLTIAAFVGAVKYQLKHFAWTMFGCLTLSFMCFLRFIFHGMDSLVLCLAVYSFGIMKLGEQLIINEENKEKSYALLLKALKTFGVINLSILALFTVAVSGMGILSGIAVISFAGLFLNSSFYSETKLYGIYPFTGILLIGFAKLGTSYELDRIFLMIAIAGTMILLGSIMNVLNENVKKALNMAAMLAGVSSLIFGGAVAVVEETWTLYRVAATAIILLNMTGAVIKYRNKTLLYLQPIVLISLLWGVIEMVLPRELPKGMVFSLACLMFFGVYYFLKISKERLVFRTRVSDGVFVIGALWGGMYRFSYEYAENFFWELGVPALISFGSVCILVCLLSAQKEACLWRKMYGFILPHTFILLLFPIAKMAEESANGWLEKYLFLVYVIILTMSAVIGLMLQRKYHRLLRYENPFGVAVSLYSITAFILSVQSLNTGYYPIYLWLFAFYWMMSYQTAQKKEDGARGIDTNTMFYIAGSSLLLAVFFTAKSVFPNLHNAYMLCAPAAVAMGGFGVYLLLSSREETDTRTMRNLYYLSAVSLYILACMNTGLYLVDDEISPLYGFVSLALISTSFGALYIKKNSQWSILPLILIYPAIYTTVSRTGQYEQSVYALATLLVFFILWMFSHTLYKYFYEVEEIDHRKRMQIDWLAIINVTAPLYLILLGDKNWQFAGCMLLALYVLSFYRRLKAKHANRIIFTIAIICIAFACWIQPFMELPKVFEAELNLLPLIGIAFLVQKIIWKGAERVTSIISLLTALVCLLRLGVDAVSYENAIDTLVIGISALAILLISFYYKRKSWFVLSTVTLVFLVLYMSKSFWLSLAWWIYLLAAGIILIGTAAANERFKGKDSNLVKKMGRWMSDWSW